VENVSDNRNRLFLCPATFPTAKTFRFWRRRENSWQLRSIIVVGNLAADENETFLPIFFLSKGRNSFVSTDIFLAGERNGLVLDEVFLRGRETRWFPRWKPIPGERR